MKLIWTAKPGGNLHEVYCDNVYGIDGKVYTPFNFTMNGNEHYWGIAYTANSQVPASSTYDKLFKKFTCTVKQLSYTSIYETTLTNYITNETYYRKLWNNDKKIGIFVPNMLQIGGDRNLSYQAGNSYNKYQFQNVASFAGDIDSSDFWNNVQNLPKPALPFELDISKTGGGKGNWDDDNSDNIELPNINDLNSNSINGTNFMTLYQLSAQQLNNLGNALWSVNLLQHLSNSALKPTDYILSFCMLPIYAGGTVKEIKAGGFTLSDMTEGVTVNGTVTTNQYFRLDCGELEITEKWGSAIDYQTDISLYLPFIGQVKLSPQDVMASKIRVIYTVDLMSGNCIASVKVSKGNLNSAIYSFTGNCSASYPISARDFSTMFGSIISASASIMGAATATKVANSLPDTTKRQKYLKEKATERATASWEGAGMQATNNLLAGNFSPDVVRCGTMSANVGFMGIKKPFLIISRLKQSLPDNFGKHAGYMCNVTKKLADCKGFTQVRFIHLDGIIATTTEKNELDNLLKEGVIIK